MFFHEKKLFHPVEVEKPNPQYAVILQEQLGGGNGELKAAMQYMSQSFRIKDKEIREIIRKRYKESLKDEVVERLNTVIKAIKEDNLEEIIPFIGDSPSGDDYGCDNRYISFKDVTDCEDIGDVIDALMEK